MGGAVSAIGDIGQGAIDAVGDAGKSIDQTVRDVVPGGWTGAALIAAGAYYAPEIGAWMDSSGAVVPGSAGVAPEVGAGEMTAAQTNAMIASEQAGGMTAAEANAMIAAEQAGGAAAGAGAGAGAAASGMGSYALPGAVLGSSLIGANAAKSAGATQAAAADKANQLAYQMYQEQKGLQEPYRAAGVTAQNRLMDVLGLSGNTGAADYGIANKNFTPSDLTTDPSYNFRLTEGLKALDRQAAARGGLISGGAIKAAQDYGQQSASQEYQNAFNRYQTNRSNLLQPLGSLVTSGQNAAANTGAAAGNYSTTAGNNITGGAAANAAGTVGATNALTNGLNSYLNYSSNQNLADSFRQSAYGKA